MKAMIVSDFIQLKRTLLSTLLITVVVSAVIVMTSGTPIVGAAAIAAMIPYLMVYTLLGNDEVAGWSKMRDTLPLTRRDVIVGRYVSALAIAAVAGLVGIVLSLAVCAVGAQIPAFGNAPEMVIDGATILVTAATGALGICVALILLAIVLPFIMRLGFTRSTRILPILFVLVFCFGVGLIPNSSAFDTMPDVSLPAAFAAFVVITLVVYAASAVIAIKLYETREF